VRSIRAFHPRLHKRSAGLVNDVSADPSDFATVRFQAALLDSVGQAVIATDVGGIVIYWNGAAERLYGWTAQEAVGRSIVELTPAPQSVEEAAGIFAELAAGRSWEGEFVVRDRNGNPFPVHVTDTPVFGTDGALQAIIGISTDITERKRAEQTVRHLSAIVESSSDAIIGTALDGTIVSWNSGAQTLYGYVASEVTGQHIRILASSAAIDEEFTDLLRRVAQGQRVEGLETVRRHKDGRIIDVSLAISPVYDDDGSMSGFSVIARDDSARKEAERALSHQALHDALTGLPNRVVLQDRLHQALARSRRHHVQVAVMFLDVDDFKLVNDGLGHLAGDDILVQVAHRLRTTIRPEDTVARFGGDEFVIICEVSTVEAAIAVGHRLLGVLEAPFRLSGQDAGEGMRMDASIGLVMAAEDAAPEALLQDADTAMYRAKARGGGCVELFDVTMRESACSRLATSTALRCALERSQMRVFYQPVVSIRDPHVIGVEALVRWQHPEWGLLSPAEFIPLAEETGLIVPIGLWVLQQALRDRAKWQAALPGNPQLRLAVNLSARQLSDPNLLDDVAAAMAAVGVDPGSLILEITESVIMRDLDSLAIDDFGTGYSSLAYLKDLPVDAVKIDRAFVSRLGSVAADESVVTAVIAIAAALSLDVVAEGVETELQLSVLRDLGCHVAQGFLFARPMPYDDLLGWLHERGTAAGCPPHPVDHIAQPGAAGTTTELRRIQARRDLS
jgi:diguanylate cyclase (GGDEF)-like protein/PAS domain S-box-containing protein